MAGDGLDDTGAESAPPRSPRLPPRWFVRTARYVHRGYYRLTGGRRGLWRVKPGKWGTMRLTTVGRRSGKERVAILGYYEDGANLVTLAKRPGPDHLTTSVRLRAR